MPRSSFFKLKAFRNECSGSVAIEGGIIFPLFLMVLYAVIELSRALYANFELDYAVDKTSRYAMVHADASKSDIETLFNNELINLDADNLISFNMSEVVNADKTTTTKISTSYKFELFIPLANYREFTFDSEQTFLRF